MIAVLGLVHRAHAWEHAGSRWAAEDMPIPYQVADDGTPDTDCEDTVPPGACRDAAVAGFVAWTDIPCVDVAARYDGVCPNKSDPLDHENHIVFDDPDEGVEVGTWAVAYVRAIGAAGLVGGEQYQRIVDADIVFNDHATFVTHEVALDGCVDAPYGPGADLLGVMVHELGHLFGMDHDCEDPNKGGEPCTDLTSDEIEEMYWTLGVCDPRSAEVSEDDHEGFAALYGPYATFSCSPPGDAGSVIGVAPFELRCAVTSDDLAEITSVEWHFGDETTGAGPAVSHTYAERGTYTVQVAIHGEHDSCGPEGFTWRYLEPGYVRVCGVPEPVFEVEQVDGLAVRMINDSDVSVYGCLSAIEWQVYEGEGVDGTPIGDPIRSWEPQITLPVAGTYTVAMHLGGIGGTGAAAATFLVDDGLGCRTAPTGGVLFAGVAALAARRRRRP